MIANRVRHIALPGKRRHRDERHSESELIKTGALVREGAGWIRGKRGTERFFNIEADRALGASACKLAGRRVGSVGTTSGHDSIRGALALLPRSRWGNGIGTPAILVRSDEGYLARPECPSAHS